MTVQIAPLTGTDAPTATVPIAVVLAGMPRRQRAPKAPPLTDDEKRKRSREAKRRYYENHPEAWERHRVRCREYARRQRAKRGIVG